MNNSWYNIKVREEVLADIEIFLKDNPNHSIIIEKISNLSVRDMMDVNYMTTIKEIADCYSFVDYVKENNVEIRPMSVSKRIYSLNEYSFDIIDSKEKAYVLGLFFADGYNSEKEGKIKITLLEQDKDILEKAKKVFETNRPLKIK